MAALSDGAAQSAVEDFDRKHRLGVAPAMRRVELAVLGADYGATSYTTLHQATELATRLHLGPGVFLLDLGAGCGWPGLLLAKASGCRVVLADRPETGLRIARQRAVADGLASRCDCVQASGASLPFCDRAFDAITHTDVLCCLEPKLSALQECRRVLRSTGRMGFHVIFVPSSLSDRDKVRAAAAGPPCVAASASYPELLARAGFGKFDEIDLTDQYRATAAAWFHQSARAQEQLEEILGIEGFALGQQERDQALTAIDSGLLKRSLFVAGAG